MASLMNPRKRHCDILIIGIFGALLGLGASNAVQAAEQAGLEPARDQKIHITADRMISKGKEMFAEFSGNVRATRGKEIITCDRLQVYLQEGAGSQSNTTTPVDQNIREIVALDNVKIQFEDKQALTAKAVYSNTNRTIILAGPDSTITSSTSTMTGSKITVYLDEDRIVAEGGVRVEHTPQDKPAAKP